MSDLEKQKQVDLKETPDDADGLSSTLPVSQAQTPVGTEPDSLVGQIVGNHYKIVQPLGQGGLGAVYKAQHEYLGTFCAIKFMLSTKQFDGKALQRFQREAEAAVGLRHPYIAGVQEFGVHEGQPFIVMEFVEGTPLDQILHEEKKLPPSRALTFFKQTAEALSYAHKQRVIHRDIKPANIMICKDKNGDEVAKIIDFGIAKLLDENEARDLTQTGEVFGTPKYMSPEQCQGKKVDHRSDLYSLGCVAYEMLSGSPPFTADSAIELIMKHVNEPAQKLLAVKELKGIQHVLARLLAKDPKHRHDSSESLLLDLQLIERGAKPTRFIDPTSMRRKVLKVTTISLLAGALGLFVYTIIFVITNTIFFQTLLIGMDPKNAPAYAQRAEFHAGFNNHTDAIRDYTKAIEIAPKNRSYYEHRAYEYWLCDDMDGAFADYSKVIELGTTLPVANFGRAQIQLEREQFEGACRDATSALAFKSDNRLHYNSGAYALRASAENGLNQWEKALADANKAIELQTQFPDRLEERRYWTTLAVKAKATALVNLGRAQEAIPALDAAIAKHPRSHELLATRSKAKLALHDPSAALKDVEQAMTLSKGNNAYTALRDLIVADDKTPR